MQQAPASRRVVLVIEDEPLLRLDALHIIETAGYATLQASSAAEAVAFLEQRDDIKAVFSDIQIMGEPDGLRLAHIVRERWPPTGLVLTSGWSTPTPDQMPVSCLFLPKPYTPQALIRALETVIPESRV